MTTLLFRALTIVIADNFLPPSIYFDYLQNAPVFLELLKRHFIECIGGHSVHSECGIFKQGFIHPNNQIVNIWLKMV